MPEIELPDGLVLKLSGTVETKDLAETISEIVNINTGVKAKYREVGSYSEVLLLGLLTEQHVLAMGGPGGAKSAIAKKILDTQLGRKFFLQFSQETREDQIIGAVKGKKLIEEGAIEVNAEGSLVKHKFAVLDEIDKARPATIASSLSVLNEREAMVGSKRIKGNLKTAVLTSNMNIYELLRKFEELNELNTGKAILDRVLFKVMVVNTLSNASSLSGLMGKACTACNLPSRIDLSLVQKEIRKIQVPKEVTFLTAYLWLQVRDKLFEKQKSDNETFVDNPEDMPYPYHVMHEFSTRGAMQLLNVIKTGKYLSELLKTGKAPKDIKLTVEDIYYAHYMMIMQGPGKFKPGTVSNPSSDPGSKLLSRLILQYQNEPRTKKMLQDIKYEREVFAQEYLEALKLYQETLKNLGTASIWQDFGGRDLSTLSATEKTDIIAKIESLKSKIKAKFKENAKNTRKAINGPEDIARFKAMRELYKLKKMLQASKEIEEKAKIESAAREKEVAAKKQKIKEAENKALESERFKKTKSEENFFVRFLEKRAKYIGLSTELVIKITKSAAGRRSAEFITKPFFFRKDQTFRMGSLDRANIDEKPHNVTLTKSFQMATTEVTWFMYATIMAEKDTVILTENDRKVFVNFTHTNGKKISKEALDPVTQVSHDDAIKFLSKINTLSHHFTYALPTEAQWEYAARAGTVDNWDFGNTERNLRKYAWYLGSSQNQVHNVAQLKPNKFGLYDMYGNVREWVQDKHSKKYEDLSGPNPVFDSNSGLNIKVVKGGSFKNSAELTYGSRRHSGAHDLRSDEIGFRIVRYTKAP